MGEFNVEEGCPAVLLTGELAGTGEEDCCCLGGIGCWGSHQLCCCWGNNNAGGQRQRRWLAGLGLEEEAAVGKEKTAAAMGCCAGLVGWGLGSSQAFGEAKARGGWMKGDSTGDWGNFGRRGERAHRTRRCCAAAIAPEVKPFLLSFPFHLLRCCRCLPRD